MASISSQAFAVDKSHLELWLREHHFYFKALQVTDCPVAELSARHALLARDLYYSIAQSSPLDKCCWSRSYTFQSGQACPSQVDISLESIQYQKQSSANCLLSTRVRTSWKNDKVQMTAYRRTQETML